MLRIRLWPNGRKGKRTYRIVVAESASPVKGKYIESIGFLDPTKDRREADIDLERAMYWVSRGAQPSRSVALLLNQFGATDSLPLLKSIPGWSDDSAALIFFDFLDQRYPNLKRSTKHFYIVAKRFSQYFQDWAEIEESAESHSSHKALRLQLQEWLSEYARQIPPGLLESSRMST